MSCPFQIGQVVCNLHNPDLRMTRVGWITDTSGVFMVDDHEDLGSMVLSLDHIVEDLSHLSEISYESVSVDAFDVRRRV